VNRRRAIQAFLSIFAFPLIAAGCARAPLALPTGPGRPAPAEYPSAFRDATARCGAVRTFQGTINLSGHAGDARLRGRVDAGIAQPDRVRLEGLSPIPFGRPAFVLVGSSGDATLVLSREKRVLTGATTESIIEAITGVALRAEELLAVLTGCGFVQEPEEGRLYDDDWMAVQRGDRTNWLRRVEGTWRTVASTRGSLQVRYEAFASATPSRIRIRTGSAAAVDADITLRVSDVDLDAPLAPEVFRVDIPDDAAPISLEEFRRSLGTARSGEGAGTFPSSAAQGRL
jgi:hypothetical protein